MTDGYIGSEAARGELTQQEVIIIREMAHDKHLAPLCDDEGNIQDEQIVVNELATEFNSTPEIINKILDGEILPFAGGPLRPLPLQGCNPRYLEATRNRQRFVRGVIQRAYAILTATDFETFANSHGMTLSEAQFYLRNLGATNDRLNSERYCSVVKRHAAGQSIEQAISTFNKRARANVGT